MKRTVTQKFSYDLGGLSAYTDQEALPLVTRAVFDGKTAKLFPNRPGIKYKEAINIMDDSVVFADGAACGFNASGDTEFTQRILTVYPIKVNKSWCINDLEDYWTQIGLTPGSKYDKLPFEGEFTNFYAGLISEKVEQMLWRGNLLSSDNVLTWIDGFLTIIDAAGTAIDGNTANVTAATGITTSNVTDIFDAMIAVLPAALQGKSTVSFKVGWDTFRKLVTALRDDNNYHYSTADGKGYQDGTMFYPGYQIRVEAVHGLDGTNRIILSEDTNHIIGTDLMNEWEQFEFWYSLDDDLEKFRTRFKLGVQVAFPNEIVEFTFA